MIRRGLGTGISKTRKIETSVRFPEKIRSAVHRSMKSKGYSSRGRSKWICEALCSFYDKHKDETASELSGILSLFRTDLDDKKSIPVVMSGEALDGFNTMVDKLSKAPSSQFNRPKTQSDIILASCLSRLITEKVDIYSLAD